MHQYAAIYDSGNCKAGVPNQGNSPCVGILGLQGEFGPQIDRLKLLEH